MNCIFILLLLACCGNHNCENHNCGSNNGCHHNCGNSCIQPRSQTQDKCCEKKDACCDNMCARAFSECREECKEERREERCEDRREERCAERCEERRCDNSRSDFQNFGYNRGYDCFERRNDGRCDTCGCEAE